MTISRIINTKYSIINIMYLKNNNSFCSEMEKVINNDRVVVNTIYPY